jgi:hypothetical protein
MRLMTMMAALAAAALVAACGGGGSEAGTSPLGTGSGTPTTGGGTGATTGTGSTTGTGTTPANPLSMAVALSTTTVTIAAPATVTATLSNRSGPVVGALVTFKTTNNLGRFTPSAGTALTDDQGRAVVTLVPAAADASGAAEITAEASVAGQTATAAAGFQFTATNVAIASFTNGLASGASLQPYGQTVPTVTVTGAAAGTPVTVTLSSTCIANGKARVSPASATTTTGTATFTYTDNGCGAVQTSDALTASITNSTATAQASVPIAAPPPSSLSYVSATPATIFLRGSSLAEQSVVVFEVKDGAGNPLPGRQVTMELSTLAGGLTIEGAQTAITRTSDALGRVAALVNSGTVPTPVRVRASLVGPSGPITTVSNELTVAVGLPSQANFGLAQGTINIEGLNYIDTPNTYTVVASDRTGNPVPAGTAINFTTEGGQIQATRTIRLTEAGIARADASFVSNLPKPADGRVTILAYALGEESFKDLNGNNVYDCGEPFQDLGDPYRDRWFDGVFDLANDEFVPLLLPVAAPTTPCTQPNAATAETRLDVSIPSVGTTVGAATGADGQWSRQVYVRRAIETVLSTSTARPVWIGSGPRSLSAPFFVDLRTGAERLPPAVTPTQRFLVVSGSSILGAGSAGTLAFLLSDGNDVRLNPVAAGTTMAVEGTTGLTVKVVGGSPVPSTSEAPVGAISYEFDQNTTAGTVTIRITSPKQVTTVVGVSLVR